MCQLCRHVSPLPLITSCVFKPSISPVHCCVICATYLTSCHSYLSYFLSEVTVKVIAPSYCQSQCCHFSVSHSHLSLVFTVYVWFFPSFCLVSCFVSISPEVQAHLAFKLSFVSWPVSTPGSSTHTPKADTR